MRLLATLRWAVASVFLLASSAAIGHADVFINEIDADTASTDVFEWVEITGTAGTSLNAYELLLINQAGTTYTTVDLATPNFTFADETGTGWGFFVLGLVEAAYAVSPDFTPAGWDTNEIQNGPTDSIQLRLKAGPVNVHLIDYAGNNTNTSEDQATTDIDVATAQSSLYLTGAGNAFSQFTFAITAGAGTPGGLNSGQTLTAVPEASSFIFGGLICMALGIKFGGRHFLARFAS